MSSDDGEQMTKRKTVAVLFHESTPPSRFRTYRIWHVAEYWTRWGIDVRFVQGPSADVSADLLIPHIDLSVIPDEYLPLLDRAKMVMNRRIVDIRKTAFSRNLVTPDDDYDGPVIVKTNCNYAGHPERHAFGKPPLSRRVAAALRQLARTHSLSKLAYTDALNPNAYPIYPSKRRLPRGVFENPNLVVERFVPEMDGSYYYIRGHYFLGSVDFAMGMRSKCPVIKGANATDLEYVPVDESIIAARHEMGFDCGKFDYVIHDGEAVLLDVNQTPTFGRVFTTEHREEIAARLARGITAWFPDIQIPD